MKKYLLAFTFIAFVTGFCIAQTETEPVKTSTATETTADSTKQTAEPQIIVKKVNPSHTSPYYQTYKPFTMSANSTANMYPTVSAAPGGGISIKGGRAENNAYFYNGVRVMDNLPPIIIPNPTFDIK
jgi:hypothetical protein